MSAPAVTAVPLVYVDNVVIGCLTDTFMNPNRKLSLNRADVDALDALSVDVSVGFVTSPKAWEEILKTRTDDQRVILKFLYRLMTKVPLTVGVQPLPLVVTANRGRSHRTGTDNRMAPLLLGLSQIFELDDAEHIFQAANNGCRYFLTVDYHSILNRRSAHVAELQKLLPDMKLVSPSELIRYL